MAIETGLFQDSRIVSRYRFQSVWQAICRLGRSERERGEGIRRGNDREVPRRRPNSHVGLSQPFVVHANRDLRHRGFLFLCVN